MTGIEQTIGIFVWVLGGVAVVLVVGVVAWLWISRAGKMRGF